MGLCCVDCAGACLQENRLNSALGALQPQTPETGNHSVNLMIKLQTAASMCHKTPGIPSERQRQRKQIKTQKSGKSEEICLMPLCLYAHIQPYTDKHILFYM